MSDTIRIAHLADTHLGYRALNKQDPATGRNQRTVDFERAFEWVVDDILREKPDAVVHAGDVFHHTRPTWQTMRHFIQQMRRIEDAGIPTLVIAGNHDTPRIRTGGSAYSVLELALPKIRFAAEYTDVREHQLFRPLNLAVQAIPHGALTNDDPILSAPVRGPRNLLVIHGMVRGILEPGRSSEPGEELLDSTILDRDFDYIALGHYHLHMPAPGAGNAWYSGSTERTGWGDREATPGYVIVTLSEPGAGFEHEHRSVPPDVLRPMIDLGIVHGEGKTGRDLADEVIARLRSKADPRAMTRVTLRDTERPYRREAESILRREAEQFAWSFQIAQEATAINLPLEREQTDSEIKDIRELFNEFIIGKTGNPYSERFAAAFRDRGDQALVEAIRIESELTPEGDTLS